MFVRLPASATCCLLWVTHFDLIPVPAHFLTPERHFWQGLVSTRCSVKLFSFSLRNECSLSFIKVETGLFLDLSTRRQHEYHSFIFFRKHLFILHSQSRTIHISAGTTNTSPQRLRKGLGGENDHSVVTLRSKPHCSIKRQPGS